jgi:dihydroorotase
MTRKWYKPQETKSEKILLTNARMMDPESNMDMVGSLDNGLIIDFGKNIDAKDAKAIDCKGNLLVPGLIDIQVHFREPGQTHKETLESGSKSAVAGGVTRVVCQPNTNPVIDNVIVAEFVKNRAKETAYCNVETYACISKNMKGEELTDMGALKDAGVVGFTDDGLPLMNAQLMRRAFEYAKMYDLPIVQHAEDLNLTQGGCINEGAVSFDLGVTGIPNISESTIVERDISILELIGGRYHVLHVSTKESVRAIRRGKSLGLNVTAEAAPHHFLLTDEAVREFGTLAKMNPPLRSEEDRLALIEGLKDGTIDAIATDHAPHDPDSKNLPLANATFGIVGVEVMLPLSLELYNNGHLSLMEVISKMTNKAADILKLKAGRIKKNYPADLTLIDLNQNWTIHNKDFASKSKNSPFEGRKVKGRAVKTFVNGKLVYEL